MKHASTRSIPAPIDLSVSGSNFRRADIPGTTDKDRTMGGHHPYTFACKYIIELDEATSPAPPSTPPTFISSSSLTPGPKLNQAPTPSSPRFNVPVTSTSTGSLLSPSEWDNTKLVPNRRRRSYSESAYSPDSPSSSTQRSTSGPTYSAAPSTSRSADFSNGAGSATQIRSFCPSPSFNLGFRSKLIASPSTDSFNPHQHRPSTGGRRGKLWSSITHLPLSASVTGHGGDSYSINPPMKKTQRPGTSPSTSSFWASSFTDTISSGTSNLGRVGSSKRRKRPSTASSTPSSSGPSPSPLRSSKLDWHWQWKRLSRLRTSSSSSISLAPAQSSPASQQSSPSSLSAPSISSTPFPPSSSSLQFPTTPKTGTSQTLRTPSTKDTSLSVLPSPNLRNRSTPNLQAPGLSMEDLGKINAFFAPPPPARTIQALNESPRCRATSSGAKQKPTLPLPPEFPEELSKGAWKPLPNPKFQASVGANKSSKGQGIPIALPLSQAGNVGAGWESEEEIGVIYLTVEDVLDEESGEPTLRLVEIPN